MDANASHALRIAAGMVIAVIIISVLVLLFNNIRPFQENLDEIQATEQTTEFNKTFLAYDKDLMYGADIISVLNKAASINQLYMERYGNFNDLRDNYLINIHLEIDTTVKDFLHIYYLDTISKKEDEYHDEYSTIHDLNTHKNTILNGVGRSGRNDLWTRNEASINAALANGNYDLLVNSVGTKYCQADLYNAIIVNTTDLRKTFINSDNTTKHIWSKAILDTAEYNFKKLKFRCTGIDYSTQTSRIINMNFEEVR